MPTEKKFDTEKHKKQREYAREYRSKNNEKRKEWNRDWIAKNRERYNASKYIYRDKLKLEAMTIYGNGAPACSSCGETDIDVLCLDHIDDNGAEHRKKLKISSRGGSAGGTTYAALKKLGWPEEGLQVLCANCNMRKEQARKRRSRMENKYYAHYRKTGEMPSVKTFKEGPCE